MDTLLDYAKTDGISQASHSPNPATGKVAATTSEADEVADEATAAIKAAFDCLFPRVLCSTCNFKFYMFMDGKESLKNMLFNTPRKPDEEAARLCEVCSQRQSPKGSRDL